MTNQSENIPSIDLVIVIDTSPSMKDEAQALSTAAEAAIEQAKSSCPSNLQVTWLGIEGIWKETKFTQTVRAYLTQTGASESSLRGRKRGTLKSAGAQEDAARAIEDIANYFNWRENATKAIFYLGDEALEGGGGKVNKKDVQAANLAIEKAQAAGVIVHTYFGTSKSKHRADLAAEYARVATETGGEAFTQQDTIRGFATVLERVICRSSRVETTQEAQIDAESASAVTSKTTEAEDAMLLTIDTKNNCYIIPQERMNDLQQNIATTFEFEQGTYEVQISSGRYSYTKDAEGEPFVLLWLYGVEGSTFVNLTTGFEVGATWSTLNGYGDKLRLEVKDKAVLCALFFDIKNRDRSGSVKLKISGDRQGFAPQELTVDSQQNCYLLDEHYLASLKQWGTNIVELEPGNYRIKIREGNAKYWSGEQKFQLEPWALLWLKSGKFIPKLTGIAVDETWCSLNGFKDEIIIEVESKTTLSGFFFDTYKEDNEGQIILAVEPVSATELAEYKQISSHNGSAGNGSTGSKVAVSTGTTQTVSGFSFRFDEAQMEQMWQQMAAKIETSVSVADEQDEKKEAYYWDNLEKWLLKGYQSQAKSLAMQVARLEFMLKSVTQQMEVSFNQNFQGWSSYFDQRLNELVDTRITSMVDEQVNIRVENQTQAIKSQVVQQLQSDIDQRIDAAVNLRISNQTQEIKNQVVQQMQADIDSRVESVVNLRIDNQAQEINTQVVQQLQSDIDQRIDAAVSLKIADQAQNIRNQVVQQMRSDVERQINSAVHQSTDNSVQVVVNNVMSDLDNRINVNLDNKILNFRNDVSSIVSNEINNNYTESLKTTILSDIKKQQFYLDMQSIKAEVENFYARLGQFETQLYLRIERGDTQLYNWTLEQLVALQGCISDRQTLADLFESFATRLKDGLDNAPCVSPSRFTTMDASLSQPELESAQPQQLPGS